MTYLAFNDVEQASISVATLDELLAVSLWSSKDAVKATKRCFYISIGWPDGISIDTRNIKPGDLFVALKDQTRWA